MCGPWVLQAPSVTRTIGTFSYNIDTTSFTGGTTVNPYSVYRQWSCIFADGTKVVSGLGNTDPGQFQCIDPVLGPEF